MKNLILIFSIVISLTSCNSDDTNKQESTVIGNWKLIETYGSDGGNNPQWNSVANGYTYTFNQNGSFTSNRFLECSEGNYSILANNLTLDYGCSNFDTGIETPAGTFVEKLVFENENLILTPTYLACIEGCDFKFEKIQQ